ncbi:hypothetical protein HZA87_02785 [Candidatus Uhrbacteria bacterium]|nr:hypothetical protein [Candidatus Uhrbacteria bacterium]
MRKKDDQSPATKSDIRILMDQIGELYDANKRWKDEILHFFDIRLEDIRHDLLGVNKDKIESHEDRIRRLERHAGFAAV